MLIKEQMQELKNAVDRVDLTKAIQDAKDMGIEVTKKELGYHGIYNEEGTLEKIDMDKHFRINSDVDIVNIVEINRNNKNETFSYTFKKEKPSETSEIEINECLVV